MPVASATSAPDLAVVHDGGVRLGERGHRLVGHTADVILEAWGPDLASCAEEAVAALVDTFAASHPPPVAQREVHLPAAPAEPLLLDVLEEVIFTLDTAEEVPVAVQVAAAADGGLDVVLLLAARADVVPTGAVPKAISRSELAVVVEPSGARGRFLVDV